jgi:hypothetical protein
MNHLPRCDHVAARQLHRLFSCFNLDLIYRYIYPNIRVIQSHLPDTLLTDFATRIFTRTRARQRHGHWTPSHILPSSYSPPPPPPPPPPPDDMPSSKRRATFAYFLPLNLPLLKAEPPRSHDSPSEFAALSPSKAIITGTTRPRKKRRRVRDRSADFQ